MWDTLQVTHEETTEVKRLRLSILTDENEIFKVKLEENINEIQKQLIYIVNHLRNLGKYFQYKDLVLAVLRGLNHSWEPKIYEYRDLATLFCKLLEHDMEFNRLDDDKEGDTNKRKIKEKSIDHAYLRINIIRKKHTFVSCQIMKKMR